MNRIIPARAGFTPRERAPAARDRDHPRSRGVYSRACSCSQVVIGSSPLARGLPPAPAVTMPWFRIIPARAGFTLPVAGSGRSVGDHPRSRGVYAPGATHTAPRCGSSPLARGLRGRGGGRGRGARIIPARAGFTNRAGAGRIARPDHPRSRGVYALDGSTLVLPPGSSPLARGLLHRALDGAPVGGIIPARAGFTRTVRRAPRLERDHPRSRGVYGAESRAPVPR